MKTRPAPSQSPPGGTPVRGRGGGRVMAKPAPARLRVQAEFINFAHAERKPVPKATGSWPAWATDWRVRDKIFPADPTLELAGQQDGATWRRAPGSAERSAGNGVGWQTERLTRSVRRVAGRYGPVARATHACKRALMPLERPGRCSPGNFEARRERAEINAPA